MFEAIPHEMRAFAQWVMWKYEVRVPQSKPTKVPYNPQTGNKASVTDPRTWATFEQAVRAFTYGGYDGIGFVLTDGDPFAVIDLDDTHGDGKAYADQKDIYDKFATYAELSPSGRGLHLIFKARLPHGRRRYFVELYTSERFITMTGNVYGAPVPIEDRQQLAEELFASMGGPAATYIYGEDQPQTEEDQAVIQRAKDAANGDKFWNLYIGEWQQYYPSQSEADFALVDIIAFYTQNRTQISRIFRSSALGQRDKAQRDNYMAYMVNKSFDRQLPKIDIDGLRIQYEAAKAEAAAMVASADGVPPYVMAGDALEQAPPADLPAGEWPSDSAEVAQAPASGNFPAAVSHVNLEGDYNEAWPEGLTGDIAQFIYENAPRPVRRIALAGAIGLISGIVGRAYNVSATGLNQYVLLLAPTGTGKEAISSGISKLMGYVKETVPVAGEFIGPGEIRSDAALIKWLAKSPCFVSITGEFGLRLKQMSNPNASPHEVGLRRVLLDLFNKSGFGSMLNPMAYSDKDKNTDAIASPAFTLLGESTPERFYEALDESMIYEGLLPRFTIVEYKGPRPPRNPNSNGSIPDPRLVQMVCDLSAHCKNVMRSGQVINVDSSPGAQYLFDNFDRFCDRQINGNNNEVIKHLWNRAHIKALKLAAMLAVGYHPYSPVISEQQANWAINMIAEECNSLILRFERGEIGAGGTSSSNESRQMADMVRVIREYFEKPYEECAKRYAVAFEIHRDGVMPHDYLARRLISMSAFRQDRMGATNAIKRCVQALAENDDLREVNKNQMSQRYAKSAKAYVVANPARFRS